MGLTLDSPQPGTTRSVAVFGNANDIRAWSNIPYFFSNAGKRAGFITHALDLTDPRYKQRRLWWRLKTVAKLRRPKDYMLSRDALDSHWNLIPEPLRHGEIISHTQSFPPPDYSKRNGASHSFFIDATLYQLWTTLNLPLDRDRREIMARETESYRSAKFVMPMARETADVLIKVYNIDPSKVHVVRPGANLHESAVEAFRAANTRKSWRSGEPFSNEDPAVLGMIANDPIRKGFPKLVAVAEKLASRGRPVRACMVGNCPENLRGHPLVDAPGFIKKTDEAAFLAKLDSFAMGCLLSSIEPLGIGTLEALRLGIPVLGNRIGGIPDCVPSDAGFIVEPNATADEIADLLEPNLFDPQRYAQLCQAAESHSAEVTWDATVANMMRLWNNPKLS